MTPGRHSFAVTTGAVLLMVVVFSSAAAPFLAPHATDDRFPGLLNAPPTAIQFWPSLVKTAYYAGATVPIGVVGSMLLAAFLNLSLRGTSFFRTLFKRDTGVTPARFRRLTQDN